MVFSGPLCTLSIRSAKLLKLNRAYAWVLRGASQNGVVGILYVLPLFAFCVPVLLSADLINFVIEVFWGHEFLVSIVWLLAIFNSIIMLIVCIPAVQAVWSVMFGRGGFVPLRWVQRRIDHIVEELLAD